MSGAALRLRDQFALGLGKIGIRATNTQTFGHQRQLGERLEVVAVSTFGRAFSTAERPTEVRRFSFP